MMFPRHNHNQNIPIRTREIMQHNPKIYNRRSIRLKEYDYSQNEAYFITICTQNMKCLFGKIVDEKMHLNDAGKMAQKLWLELSNKFPSIELDEYVFMPNHFHGIIKIDTMVTNHITCAKNNMLPIKRAPTRGAPTMIWDIVGAFKSLTTNEYIRCVKSCKFPPFEKTIWQRNYWEHVIRNEHDLNDIREYIIYNPCNWKKDELFKDVKHFNVDV